MLIKENKNMTEAERIAVANTNNSYLQALSYVAVGTIFPFAGEAAPDTFMICDGAELDTAEYTELFSVIGYTFGGADTTFKLPDLRGRVLVGLDESISHFEKLGLQGGEPEHALSEEEGPIHTHKPTNTLQGDFAYQFQTVKALNSNSTGRVKINNVTDGRYQVITADTQSVDYKNTDDISAEYTTAPSGKGTAHNNLQPYTVCNYIIKVTNRLPNTIEVEYSGELVSTPDGTSVIMGDLENNFAGTKAFRILSGNAAEKSYVLDSVEGLEGFEEWPEEDRYLSFYVVAPDGNSSHRNDNNIRLVGVDAANNKIYTSSFYAGWPVSGFGEGSYLRFIARPELGTFWAELYAFAAGQNNKALGDGAFAVGANNLANGAYSFAAGRNNIVQYCSMAYGRFNEVPAQLSIALGQYNQLRGHNSIGLGCGLKTTETNQIAIGRYNLPDKDMLFMLGNGAEENNRNNLFGLGKDGGVYIDGQKVVRSLGERVFSLPDVGDTEKIYCLKKGSTYENYIFLQTEHKVGTPWDGSIASSYASGTGSETDPYIIESPEQFARMINSFGEDKYYELAKDISLNDVSSDKWYENGANRSWFEAVDNDSSYQYISTSGEKGTFKGHINGNGHVVYGLYYNDSSLWGGGLIPTIANGEIRNLGIDKCYVTVGTQAGALAAATGRGSSGAVTVDGCYVGKDAYIRATLSGGAAAGFFAYSTVGITTTISNSYCLSTSIYAVEGYKKNAFIGQTWNSPYRLINCYSVLRPFNTWNVKARVSSLINWTYNGTVMNQPVDKANVYENVYSEDTSQLHDNEYTLLGNEPLFTQVESLSECADELGESFIQTDGYPALRIFTGEWVNTVGGIETALDAVIALQEKYIGGEA